MPTERDFLMACLAELGGYTYDANAWPKPGTKDCTRFTYAVLVRLWPTLERFKGPLHITDPAEPFSNVQALEAAGIGAVSSQPIPGRWHLVQGWQSVTPLRKGHAFFWYEPPIPLALPSFIVQATPTTAPWCEERTVATQTERFPHLQWCALPLD